MDPLRSHAQSRSGHHEDLSERDPDRDWHGQDKVLRPAREVVSRFPQRRQRELVVRQDRRPPHLRRRTCRKRSRRHICGRHLAATKSDHHGGRRGQAHTDRHRELQGGNHRYFGNRVHRGRPERDRRRRYGLHRFGLHLHLHAHANHLPERRFG